MSVFVDTSAFYAILDADDEEHVRAHEAWENLVPAELLVTSNYILLETLALSQNRLGMDSVRAFEDAITPLLQVLWVDATVHRQSVAALLTAGRKKLSLVDCCSFALMRAHGLQTAFAFEDHFSEQGFQTMPETAGNL